MTTSTMEADAILQSSAARPSRKSRDMTAVQERIFVLVGAAAALCAEVLALNYGVIAG